MAVTATARAEAAGSPRAARRPLWRRVTPGLLLLPGLLLFIAFFVFPLAVLVENSLHEYSRMRGILPGWSVANYARILGDSHYLEIGLRTLKLATLTSVVTLVVGYPIALYLSVASARQRAWIILLVLSPLLVSVIVRTFGWIILLGKNGLVDNLLGAFGWEAPPMLHTEGAVVLGLANVLLPFMVLSISTALQNIDPAVNLAASSLGASPWRVFTRVTVPLSLPGVLSGLLIVFSLSASSFVTPALLGGSNYKVLSGLVYEQAMVLQNWPLAAGFAVVLMALVLAVLAVQRRAIEGGKYKVVFH
jgi:putative spermidine/putrescine transport system permease protein